MKKNNKKTYSDDHVLMMFEEIKGQNKVVIEQYADITEKTGLILEDIDEIKSDVVDMKRDIKNMKEDVVEIRSELVEINEKLDNKAEKSVADDHEKRIFKLEKTSLAV